MNTCADCAECQKKAVLIESLRKMLSASLCALQDEESLQHRRCARRKHAMNEKEVLLQSLKKLKGPSSAMGPRKDYINSMYQKLVLM